MMHKLDSLVKLAKWMLNIPLIILCVDEFQKAVRALHVDDRVKKRISSKINFVLGVAFAVAYIPNVFLRELKSCAFLIASWLCLYSVSNRINRTLEKYAKIGKGNYNDWGM